MGPERGREVRMFSAGAAGASAAVRRCGSPSRQAQVKARAPAENILTGRPRAMYLGSRPCDAIEIVEPGKDITWLRSIRRSEDAGQVQLIDYASSTTVADFQAAL